MAYGLQIRDAAGNLTFDSQTALGAVCVDMVMVPSGGGVFGYPAFPARQGRWVFCGFGYGSGNVSVDYGLNYPRFVFSGAPNGAVGLYALFVF